MCEIKKKPLSVNPAVFFTISIISRSKAILVHCQANVDKAKETNRFRLNIFVSEMFDF